MKVDERPKIVETVRNRADEILGKPEGSLNPVSVGLLYCWHIKLCNEESPSFKNSDHPDCYSYDRWCGSKEPFDCSNLASGKYS